jgi:hypothetical protein
VVKNKYNFLPVESAMVMAGTQATYTDSAGNYLLHYHYTEDDDRNKEVPIKIRAKNYLVLDTLMVIFPENELNVFATYAAPIIQNHALIGSICQAIVFDYQGANDIIRVYGKFAYRRAAEKLPSLHTEMRLMRVAFDTSRTGYYEARVPTEIIGYGTLNYIFTVHAEDRLSYSDSTTQMNLGSDSLLFAPTAQKN